MKHNYNPIKLGERFGKLIVAEELKERDTNGAIRYKLICDCGGFIIQTSSDFHKRRKQDCGCWRLEDKRKHIGEKIGGLEIIGVSNKEVKDYNWLAICKCVCGKTREIRYCDIKSGRNQTCGCRYVRTPNGFVKPLGRYNHSWSGYEEIPGNYLSRIKRAAKIRGYKFKLTPKYIWDIFVKQNKRCALSGIEISFFDKTASLDRINNKNDYIEGNVWWVHKDINNMKQTYTADYFISFCKRVANFS